MQLRILFVILCIFNLQLKILCQIHFTLDRAVKKNTSVYTPSTRASFQFFNLLKCKAATPCNNIEMGVKRLIADKSSNIFTTGCNNKTYLIPKEKTSVKDIWNHCCKWGMYPISVESQEEIQCIVKAYNKTRGVSKDPLEVYSTAIMDSNLDRNFTSCQTGKITPTDVWAKGQPDILNYNNFEACTSLFLVGDLIGLHDYECRLTQYYVICEISDEVLKPILEKMQKIEKRRQQVYDVNIINYFKSNKLENCGIAVPCSDIEAGFKKFEKEGEDSGIVLTGCNGKTYFIPKEMTLIQDLWSHCCKWGMYPISLDSREEIRCLSKVYSNISGGVRDKIDEYYTSYLDSNLDRNFVSCKNGQGLPPELWAGGQPDNWLKKEACISFILNPKNWGLHDYECKTSPKHAICEISNEERKNTMEATEKKRNLIYATSAIKYFKENNLLYCEAAVNCTNNTAVKSTISKFQEKNKELEINGCNGKEYLITAEKGVAKDMWRLCCAWGMQPATFTTKDELKCINRVYLSKNGGTRNPNHEYFIGHLDANLNRDFISCKTGKSTAPELWAKSQPDNARTIEACVVIKFDLYMYGFHDFDCDTLDEKHILCKRPLPDVPKNESISKLTINQYAENVNVTKILNCQSAHCNKYPSQMDS